MTALDHGSSALLFVTNVLNGTVAASPKTVEGGTIVRVDLSTPSSGTPTVTSETVIGTGFAERTDPGALVVGPTGLALSRTGTLYVANSVVNKRTRITGAATRSSSAAGTTLTSGGSINDPLGLAIAPNSDLLSTNGRRRQPGRDDAVRRPGRGEDARHEPGPAGAERQRNAVRSRRRARRFRRLLRRRAGTTSTSFTDPPTRAYGRA
jgi:hypothetical protein